MDRLYEGILFDFDGVLVDSEPVHFACWTEVLAPFRIRLEWDYYAAHCIGVADRAMVRTLADLAGDSSSFDELWKQYPVKQNLFRKRMLESVPMPEATRELLSELAAYRLAVVSSSGRSEVEPPLVEAGVRNRFQVLICREDVRELKPAPEPYVTAASRLGIQSALVVEDSNSGEASGRAAGFDVLRVRYPDEVAHRVRERLNL